MIDIPMMIMADFNKNPLVFDPTEVNYITGRADGMYELHFKNSCPEIVIIESEQELIDNFAAHSLLVSATTSYDTRCFFALNHVQKITDEIGYRLVTFKSGSAVRVQDTIQELCARSAGEEVLCNENEEVGNRPE